MEIILIRHGQTEGNKENRYIGSTDETLCQEGRMLLQKARRTGFYPAVKKVYASPMKRCLETAQLLFPEAWPTLLPGLRERDFGRYEGKNYADLKDDEPYQAWVRSSGSIPFPDGEDEEEVKKRTLAAFDEAVAELKRQADTLQDTEKPAAAFVVHGGTIMTILSERLTQNRNSYFKYMSNNGDYFRLEMDDKELLLLEHKRIKKAW